MMFSKRTHCVKAYESPEEIARLLVNNSWTLCTGFQYKNTLWLNDATNEDALQEYAVCRYKDENTLEQLESITVSWCTEEQLVMYLKWLAGEGAYISDGTEDWITPQPYRTFPAKIDLIGHHRCHLCA